MGTAWKVSFITPFPPEFKSPYLKNSVLAGESDIPRHERDPKRPEVDLEGWFHTPTISKGLLFVNNFLKLLLVLQQINGNLVGVSLVIGIALRRSHRRVRRKLRAGKSLREGGTTGKAK